MLGEADPKDSRAGHAAVARRARPPEAAPEPVTDKQPAYLTTLVGRVGRERFDAAFGAVVQGAEIAPREAQERTGQALGRLTRPLPAS
jgi:hypothetical protein